MKPLLLDLFCGAGGAAMGYHRAGFDIVGVDVGPQPNYPFSFIQTDAVLFLRTFGDLRVGADAIHASPPCRDHSVLAARWGKSGSGWLLDATRNLLLRTESPYVIENVRGAEMRADCKLCGCMFDLPGLRRERWFETNLDGLVQPPHRPHVGQTVTVSGHPGGSSRRDGSRGFANTATWRRAMGIDWMTAKEMAQAIPPAYTEYIGQQLLRQIADNEEAVA